MLRSLVVAAWYFSFSFSCCVLAVPDEEPDQAPSSKQLFEMAAAELTESEMDNGLSSVLYNGIEVLVAVGRFDDAFSLAMRSENEIQRGVDAAMYVSALVKFRAEHRLDDARLKAAVQPRDIAEYAIFGFFARGDLDEAEARLQGLWMDHTLLMPLIDQHLRITEQRIANKETESVANSLELTIECISLESGRKPGLYTWLQQLENCSRLVSTTRLNRLIPEVVANAELGRELLKDNKSAPQYRAQFYSNLAAAYVYCEKLERAEEQLQNASELVDRSLTELRQMMASDSSSSATLNSTADGLLQTTGRIAGLLARIGRTEDARKRIESTKAQLKEIAPDIKFYDDWNIVKMVVHYGAWDLAEEHISAAVSKYWRCHFQVTLCEQLARQNRREDAVSRLIKVIPEFSEEPDFVSRVGLQSDALRLLVSLDEEELSSRLLREILTAHEGDRSPRALQSLFLLLVSIRDYDNAWKLFQERELAGSKAMNLAIMGASRHKQEVAALREK